MNPIALYLEKAASVGLKEHILKQTLAAAILEVCGATVLPQDIKISAGEVVVTSDPTIKNKMHQKERKLLAVLKDRLVIKRPITKFR